MGEEGFLSLRFGDFLAVDLGEEEVRLSEESLGSVPGDEGSLTSQMVVSTREGSRSQA